MTGKTQTLHKISTRDLELGMFVAELDIPWLESPFMLQGFLLEHDEQRRELRTLCREVMIDKSLSTGEHFKAPERTAPVSSTQGKAALMIEPSAQPAAKRPIAPTSFFNILQDLRAGEAPTLALELEVPLQPPLADQSKASLTDATTMLQLTHVEAAEVRPSLWARMGGWLQGLRGGSAVQATVAPQQEGAAEGEALADARTIVVSVEEEIAHVYPQFAETEADTREVFDKIAQGANVDLVHVSASLDRMLQSIERNPDALLWLSRLRQTDDYAYNKALYVSINMMAFGHFLSLPRLQVKELGLAGLFQDIGKIHIPADILQKPGELDEAEFMLVKQHVQASLDTLQENTDISANVMQIVAEHHERFDGSGYPNHVQGSSISLLGQIAGLLDTYCAMTTNKPYAKGMFSHEVLEALYASRNRKFSESLVDQLIQFFGIYPVSSLVELNSGEVAVVIQQNQIRRLQPKVMLLLDYNKKRIHSPMTIDLIHAPLAPSGQPYQIVRGLPPDSFGLNTSDYYH